MSKLGKNDKNDNGIPDDIDRAIMAYMFFNALQVAIIIIGFYIVMHVLGD